VSLRRLINFLALLSLAGLRIAWTEPVGTHSPAPPLLSSCFQSSDDPEGSGQRHTHYYLCQLPDASKRPGAADSIPPRSDPNHLLAIDWAHYPEEAKIRHVEGRCVVSAIIGKDGRVERGSVKLEQTSDSVFLDFPCLHAFFDAHLLPATLHGRPVSQRVGLVAVWTIDGPVPIRPKEHQVVSLCKQENAPFPAATSAPSSGVALLAAAKLASDKGWLLDPCFYRDEALKQFFGATRIDRFFDQVPGKDPARSEGIDLVVPGSVYGHSGPGILSATLNIVFLPSGIQRAELRVSNNDQIMPSVTRDDIEKLYGAGKAGIDLVTDGGPSLGTLEYDSLQANIHTHSLFVLGANLDDLIVTTGVATSATGYPLPPKPPPPPPVTFKPLPTEPPPGELRYVVTDLDVFDEASRKADYLGRLQAQMRALDCCATNISKLFSGFRLQVRGYALAPFLPRADQDLIAQVAGEANPPLRAVNLNSEAVGTFWQGHAREGHGYLVRAGKLTDLGTLGGRGSEANAINNCGQIAGASELMFGPGEDVFIYQGGVMKDLGPGHGNAISDNGMVAGQRSFGFFNQRAALWIHGNPKQLCDSLSEAFAINNAGAVVGECYDPDNMDQPGAFLYQDGRRVSLRDYIARPRRPGVRGSYTIGAGINDAGQIIVYEYEIPSANPQDEIFYLLTPATHDALASAQKAVTPEDRELWLGRCNRLADVRGISIEDRQKFLDWCGESAVLAYLKQRFVETRRAPTSCIALDQIVPANIEDAEVPYRVRIPVTPEKFVQELAKLATVARPQDAARQLGQGLGANWRRKREGDRVSWALQADARWKASLYLSSGPESGWNLAAGGQFGHDQLVFVDRSKSRCLQIDLVDRVLKSYGFIRSDYQMPLRGPFVQWQFKHGSTTFSIGGDRKDECLPELRVTSTPNAPP
jgi:hypothetical protein